MPSLARTAIALGSNLGDRRAHLAVAVGALASLPLTALCASSLSIETAPVGGIPQGPYLNAAAVLLTCLTPRDLLARLLAIEASRGRDRAREQRWGPRTLDLDIILYGDTVIDVPGLTIPHPRMHERGFVLRPLAEIAPDMIVPPTGRTVAALLAALSA